MSNIEGNITSSQELKGNIEMRIGVTPDIQVGTTTTLEPYEQANVELDEASTKLKPIFNFSIPKGEDGKTPEKGTDYWTEEDKKAVQEEAIKVLDPVKEEINEAETIRNQDEAERKENEITRNENESTRIANEIMRQEKFRMIDNALKSISVEGSNIHVEDSADWFAKVNVFGKSEQETREGYNKANYNTSSTEYNFDIGDVKAETNYTLSFKITGNATANIRYKISKENIKSSQNITDTKYILNFKSAYDEVINFNAYASTTNGFTITEIMLLEGTYTADTLPEFEEYGKMPSLEFESPVECVTGDIEVELCNKNLFDIDKFKSLEEKNTYVTYDNKECLKLRATSQRYDFKGRENTQYVFRFNIVGRTLSSEPIGGFVIKYTDGTTDYYVINDNKEYTCVTKEDKTLETLVFNGWSSGHYYYIEKDSMQLEVGTVATDHTPHQSQLYPLHIDKELHGDETVRDRIVRKDGKWCYEFKWAKYAFTGNETSVKQSAYNEIYQYDFTMSNEVLTKNDSINRTKSNYFKGVAWHNSWKIDEAITSKLNENVIRIMTSKYTTINDLKIFMAEKYASGEPLYAVYLLAEPIYEEITDEVLIAQLDALEKAYTYQTVTNIMSDAHLEVTYKKDLQTQLNEVLSLTLESGV